MALNAGDILTYDGTQWVNQPAVQGPFGIGITNPSSLLHVVGSQPAAVAGWGTTATQVLQITGGKGGNTTGTGVGGGTGAALNLTSGAGGDAPAGSTNGNGGDFTIQGGAPGSGAGAAGAYGRILLAFSGGNVGIGGYPHPSANLHVLSSGSLAIRLQVTGANGGTFANFVGVDNGQKYWSLYDLDGAAHRLYIYNNGNIGIGTNTPSSLLHVNGAIATAVANKTAAYTLTATDSVITGDASGGAFTVTLPAVGNVTGRPYTVKKTDASANAVTLAAAAGETIDGAANYVLSTRYQFVTVVSNGSSWSIVAK